MEIIFTDGSDERFARLCRELDGDLNDAVGGEKQRAHYNQYNLRDDIRDVALALEDGTAVACGSFKRYSEGVAEVKRVYTQTEYRGRGYARAVMQALEERARAQGYAKLILETGRVLTAAMGMYATLGFRVIDNYGPYANMPDSVCMEKAL